MGTDAVQEKRCEIFQQDTAKSENAIGLGISQVSPSEGGAKPGDLKKMRRPDKEARGFF